MAASLLTVDASVSPVCTPPLLLCLVDLNVGDDKSIYVQTLDLQMLHEIK